MKRFCILLCFAVCYGQKNSFWRQIGNQILNPAVDQTQITRPCPNMDVSCVRRFLAQNSQCTPAYGKAPEPYLLKRLEMPIPHSNLTCTWINADVTGLSRGEIKEFYVNRATNKLLLEVEFDSIYMESLTCSVLYHFKGREPVEVIDYCDITIRMTSITLTVPFSDDIDMSEAEIYTYVGEPTHPVKAASSFTRSGIEFSEPFEHAVDDISTTLREGYIIEGPVFLAVFLDSSVCSFKNQLNYLLDWQHRS